LLVAEQANRVLT